MRKLLSQWCLLAAFAAGVSILAALISRNLQPVTSDLPLHDWDIPALVNHLNRAGLEVHLRSSQENGNFLYTAFLTSVDKDWHALNGLSKNPRRIHEWRGTVYCERVGERDPTELIDQWGDRCLAASPFLFYGDAELLGRIHAALAPPASR